MSRSRTGWASHGLSAKPEAGIRQFGNSRNTVQRTKSSGGMYQSEDEACEEACEKGVLSAIYENARLDRCKLFGTAFRFLDYVQRDEFSRTQAGRMGTMQSWVPLHYLLCVLLGQSLVYHSFGAVSERRSQSDR